MAVGVTAQNHSNILFSATFVTAMRTLIIARTKTLEPQRQN